MNARNEPGEKSQLTNSSLGESINTIRKENDMLLKKLQKAEKALSQARTGDESGDERRSIGSRPSLSKDQMTHEMRDKLEKVDQRLQSIKR